jgi:hypothetical protein
MLKAEFRSLSSSKFHPNPFATTPASAVVGSSWIDGRHEPWTLARFSWRQVKCRPGLIFPRLTCFFLKNAFSPIGTKLLLNIVTYELADFLRGGNVLPRTELIKNGFFLGVNQQGETGRTLLHNRFLSHVVRVMLIRLTLTVNKLLI